MNRKSFLILLVAFILGVIIGYCIHGLILVELDPYLKNIITVVITGSSFIAVATLVVEVVPIILNYLKKKEEERLRQDNLIIEDLKIWMEKTTFSDIKPIDWEKKIETIDHKDPDLPYLDRDVGILKNYGAYTSWEEGKTLSEELKTKGVKALQEFIETVNKAIEKNSLKKLKTKNLAEDSCSLLLIYDAIYNELNNNPMKLETKQGDLYWGGTHLAHGDPKVLKSLKEIIEDLKEDENLRRTVQSYNEVKKKLPREPFEKFEKNLKKIIAEFNFTQKLNR